MPIILDNINKSFGTQSVLQGYSARFEYGKKYCLMGASGSGKTTMFNIILGLVKPDSGAVSADYPMSAVFQEDRLLENQNAVVNVRAFVKTASESEIIAAFREVLIPESELKKPVREFSGGMRRRVALVRALLANAPVLLLDEPFKGLDDTTKTAVVAYIIEKTAGKTVICATHDTKDASLLGAEILSLG